MDSTFEQAKTFFLEGVADYEAGRYEQAERKFVASLSFVPGRPSTLANLGATRVKLGRFAAAEQVLEEAIAADPGQADAWGHRATALAELGRLAEALECTARALAIDGRAAVVWTLRGNLLRDLGRPDEAASAFEQALAHGADEKLVRYYLAGLRRGDAPATAPRAYVEGLFDSYADGFESHLVQVLRYDAPRVLADGLGERRFRNALDLGCGTGLVAEALRGRAARITGVDLSSSMVEQARARGLYASVAHADVGDYLAQACETFDLVVAADVFVYLGALDGVFAEARRIVEPGGVFAFTVELLEEQAAPWALRGSLRYAHTAGYIRTLAERNRFEFLDTATRPIREDQRTPIAGLFAWLAAR